MPNVLTPDHYLTLPHLRLHYRRLESPRPDAPTILCLHGIMDSGLCWWNLASALQAHYHFILLDQRAHGFSDAPETGYAVEDFIGDVVALLDHLQLPSVIVMGHSMGGRVATVFAAHHPERVQALILEDPAWHAIDPQMGAALAKVWLVDLLKRKTQTREELLSENQAELGAWSAIDQEAWVQSKQQVHPNSLQHLPLRFESVQTSVPHITCPTLLIYADPAKEVIILAEQAEEAKAMNPRLEAVQIMNAGHSIRRDQFKPYLTAVKTFLQRNQL